MSPLEIDFERYQRRIATLEAELAEERNLKSPSLAERLFVAEARYESECKRRYACEAEVERLKEHCTMFCVCNEHLPVPLDRKGRPALVSARRKETSP